jgi:hypothetical protein
MAKMIAEEGARPGDQRRRIGRGSSGVWRSTFA